MRRKRHAATQPRAKAVGITWFTPEQWAILKEAAVDRDKLDDTYTGWLASASQRMAELRDLGFEVRKVPVVMAELAEWCAERGLPIDGSSRSQYAAATVQRQLDEERSRRNSG
jgi:hypothetical protein